MLYVGQIIDNKYLIVNSETGVSFWVCRDGYRYYIDDDSFDMEKVLGYWSGDSCYVIPKHLVYLLGYVEDVTLADVESGMHIDFNSLTIKDMTKDGVLFLSYPDYHVWNLLDLVLKLSYCDIFNEMLESGTLVARFDFTQFLRIKLCGNYKGCISKLIAMAR